MSKPKKSPHTEIGESLGTLAAVFCNMFTAMQELEKRITELEESQKRHAQSIWNPNTRF